MKKVYLLILDGFGIGKQDEGDAVTLAHTPFLDELGMTNPKTFLKTHGQVVGLPEFQMGGSEVGHLTMGAGRAIKHILTIINDDIEDGTFFENGELKTLFTKAQKTGRIHLVGMVSDGGIHSFLPHLFGLQKMAAQFSIPNVYIHALLDGRDVGQRTARDFITQIEAKNTGLIASLSGRYYAMDRDKNWERTEAEYRILCDPASEASDQTWETYLEAFYAAGNESDYYVPPVLLHKEGQIHEDDIVICFNFRTDRMRQISAAFCDVDFAHFDRPFRLDPDQVGVFGNYCEQAHTIYSLSQKKIEHTLGQIVSEKGETQLRIAETEKFNHVTFFFSGERKEEFSGETRVLAPSKQTPNYADCPEMSAWELTDMALEALEKQDYKLVVHNYANGDIVGHSGDIPATVKAVETLDACLQKLVPVIREKDYELLITADHGNCEQMLMPDGHTPCASHSKNLVPLVYLSAEGEVALRKNGDLGDIAPTILDIFGWEKPEEMTGESLISQ